MARLNDTRSLVDSSPRGGQSHHISTEQIDNGYLIRKSVCTDTGEYKSTTKFSPKPPRVETRVVGERSAVGADGICGNESLGDAANYAGRK